MLLPGYHVALVVADLEAAESELTELIGLQWYPTLTGSSHLLVDGELVEAGPRLAFSVQGPPYLELLERLPGTVWDRIGLHHLGFWSDDVRRESDRLAAGGAPVEAAGAQPDGTLTHFCYHVTPSGLRLELVDIGQRGPKFARYLSGS